ncbi:MAG: DUF4268 domain-containing protein [Anaerolineaceae bacterium]|nr:DUF4268 domain-containing protein [Anaerolineaceae bacterium]
MATWVEDIVQALTNLGGQAELNQIYNEVKRIRRSPLPKTWKGCIQERLEAHCPGYKHFKGKDYFRKLDYGIWSLSENIKMDPPSQISSQHNDFSTTHHSDTESHEELLTKLRTIKQYRDYQNPQDQDWNNYIEVVFHILGFTTKELNQRLLTLHGMGSNDFPKAIVMLSRPGENFDEIIPGLRWESHLFFAAKYHQIGWGIITNGLQLIFYDCRGSEPKQTSSWSDLDEIIRNELANRFYNLNGEFSKLNNIISEQSQNSSIKSKSKVESMHFEFWRRLLEKARTRTKLHSMVSPGNRNWIFGSGGKTGFLFMYVIRKSEAQIDLYIDRKDTSINKRIFDEIHYYKSEIENVFGAPLSWLRLDNKQACRIQYVFSKYGLDDTAHWDEIQDQMIDGMIRLEKATKPFIQSVN